MTPSMTACPPTRAVSSPLSDLHPGERHFLGHNVTVGFTNCHAVAVRSPHHDTFHDGLSADEGGFLAAFRSPSWGAAFPRSQCHRWLYELPRSSCEEPAS